VTSAWKSNRVAIALAFVFVIGALSMMGASDRVAIVVLPFLGLAESVALFVRRSHFTAPTSRVWNGYLGVALATTPTTVFNGLSRGHDLDAIRIAAVVLAVAALLLAMYAGGLTAGPGFRVPSIATWMSLFVTGFVLSGVAMQWAWSLGDNKSGLVGTVRSIEALGAAIVACSLVPLIRQVRRIGRTAEAWCIAAAALWTLGQLVFVVQGLHARVGLVSGPAIGAIGLVAAGAWSPGAELVGRQYDRIGSARPTRTASIVMLTVMSASIALVVPVNVGWGSGASIAVSTIAVAQTALLAWFVTSAMHPQSVVSLGKSQHSARRHLRNALVKGELVPYYQPIHRATDNRVAGYECLVRWNHPRFGVLSAAQFLDVASDDHLLDSIDRLMMATTLDNLDALFATTSVDDPFVTVNIHPERFAGDSVVKELRAELDARGRSAKGLVVELTEHTAIEHWDRFTANVSALQHLGVRVAVDDFGMGHANYNLLMQCDPDFVKLDKVITSLSFSSDRSRLLLKSAFDAARAVGAKIIAEGIEDADAMGDLAALGADYFQGHALGRAQPLSALTLVS
jgi:EAL domain-containing protein (putative c-di-GMP-specific phosphodiesterase class I)